MKIFLARRLAQSLLVLLGVSFIVFFILYLTGDPALVLLPPDSSEEDVQKFRQAMGFNDPFLVQYGRFLVGALHGDFGQSVRHGEPAFGLVVERMPATFQLSGAALLVALTLAIPAGIISAVRRNTILDYISTVVALLGQSMPTFWLGIMLILVFSVQLNLLPSSGRGTFEHLILPAITLGLFTTARNTRLTRSGMLEVLSQDYIRTARAKGVSDPPVVWKHALKNAAIPIVTIVGIELGTLLGGSVITETIFAWPGVGRLSVQAIYNRDYPVVQAAVFLLSSTFVLVNLFVDIVYTYLDPRIRLRVSVPISARPMDLAGARTRPGASGSLPGVCAAADGASVWWSSRS
jgi:peptide/nickel transport system permease protein